MSECPSELMSLTKGLGERWVVEVPDTEVYKSFEHFVNALHWYRKVHQVFGEKLEFYQDNTWGKVMVNGRMYL